MNSKKIAKKFIAAREKKCKPMWKTYDDGVLTSEEYKAEVIAQLKWLGATDKDIALVTDTMIKVQMTLQVHPHDLAWALMI